MDAATAPWREDDLRGLRGALLNLPDGALREAALCQDVGGLVARLRPSGAGAVHATGYYEPELDAAPARSAAHPVPIHAAPPGGVRASRAEIEERDLLAGHEIAWLRDATARFFLQVQGSGRLRMPDGTVLRVGHAAGNGHPYVSIGKRLIERGALPAATITADAVKAWLRADPARGARLMRENPSYVMFRVVEADPRVGPLGALGLPVTAGRTVAVDPARVPLGTIAWLEVDAPEPIRRLVVAQDVGSAIVGARVDLFLGTGDAAGRAAGALNHPGRLVPLSP